MPAILTVVLPQPLCTIAFNFLVFYRYCHYLSVFDSFSSREVLRNQVLEFATFHCQIYCIPSLQVNGSSMHAFGLRKRQWQTQTWRSRPHIRYAFSESNSYDEHFKCGRCGAENRSFFQVFFYLLCDLTKTTTVPRILTGRSTCART